MPTSPFTGPTLLLWPRSAAQELGLWDTKSEAAGLDPAEMIRILHEGRRRLRRPRRAAEPRPGAEGRGRGREYNLR
jgi:hypothetical protein